MTDPQFVQRVTLVLWVPIFVLWAIAGMTAKPTTQAKSDWRSRVAVFCVWTAWFLLFNQRLGPPLDSRFLQTTPAAVGIGLSLTIVGLLFSVWARFAIGRNWSPMIDMKVDHRLIDHGPYAVVRHPIYSGFMLATFGTALAFGEWSGLLAVALIVGAWGYKARLEERAMCEQFGSEYERYRRRVKGLVPFLW
jgi:protein-S-isoprenylcysteine O-methyltransferase Ste14